MRLATPAILTLLCLSGCTTTVSEVALADGTKFRFERYHIGQQEEIGELNVTTPHVSGSLKGYKSDSSQLMADLAATARDAAATARKVTP